MKKTIFILAALAVSLMFTACAQNGKTQRQNEQTMNTEKKVLVVFFSHTGENYGVGYITKGNTHIVAEMIANTTNGTLFEIAPVQAYPDKDYNACVETAKKEKESGARPEIKADIAVEDYDVIFIGYPNWWGDMPMPVYTFIEKHDWQGKTVIPFCTHEGSGLSDTERYIAAACKGSTVGKGLAMQGTTAQKHQEQALKAVQKWLENAL
ncbi:MAG: NAD(P)H-dependent oxidoreductase [Bacteroides sp.]|nr:NAD(P)H-dependent oxidoreductase [Bacteroides sp.]MCM1085452.1 NAD(P)H-dependent oxidoreductase [Bacteroides sp.]